MTAGLVRFAFPNVLFEPSQTFRAGMPEDYSEGEVSLRWKKKYGIWIVRADNRVYALLATCTHLGCTPSWQAGEAKFKCPCHGSGFHMSGIQFEGPAPRPLERCGIRLSEDGQIMVDKTKRFLYEHDQWSNVESYIAV